MLEHFGLRAAHDALFKNATIVSNISARYGAKHAL